MQRENLLLPEVENHRFVNTIGGDLRDSQKRLSVINPATGRPFCTVPVGSIADLNDAVGAAKLAQPEWAALSPDERRALICKIGDVLVEHRTELASLLVLEQGKPMTRAMDEVTRAAQQLELLLNRGLHDDEAVDSNGRPVRLRYRPLGVVGAITPWNMPIVLMVPKIVHALYTGNAIVAKPSPYAPVPVIRYSDINEVIARANASDFGLGASVWSSDIEQATEVAQRLEAGSVWINHHIGADVNIPFSGAKHYGIGMPYSLAGLRAYMQVQALYAPMSVA